MNVQSTVRIGSAVLVTFGLLATGSPAYSAQIDVVELSATGDCETQNLCFGETVTIGLRISNPDELLLFGGGASITGYDPSVAAFSSGTATSTILSSLCAPSIGCFGGVLNMYGPSLSESLTNPAGPQVRFFGGVTISGTTNDGSQDPGLDGVVDGGGAQFRLNFQVVGAGETRLSIGTDIVYGDAFTTTGGVNIFTPPLQIVIGSDTAPYVVPEPGTAMLLGGGLLGLARRRNPRL